VGDGEGESCPKVREELHRIKVKLKNNNNLKLLSLSFSFIEKPVLL
jgi:hypothetical protein